MSILEKFEFTTSGTEGTHTATRKGDDVHVRWSAAHWKHLLRTEDNPWTVAPVKEVEPWLEQYDGWIVTRDLSDPEFPYQFKHQTADHNIVFTANDDGENVRVTWGDGNSTSYTKVTAEIAVRSGVWIIQKPEQPSLVFPFTFVHNSDPHTLYTAVRVEGDGSIYITWDGDSISGYNEEVVKSYIEKGVWTVKSIGEQKPVEAPTSNEATKMSYTIQVDTEDALEAIKELTKAVEELTKAFNRASEAQDNFKGVAA
ncbi:MAG: hypothetical protein ACXW1D_00855 [Halobacteriota archaeon]